MALIPSKQVPRDTEKNSFEVTGMSVLTRPVELTYNPDMARLIDDTTEIIEDNSSKSVDNIMIKPLPDGSIDISLTHTIEEKNDIVLKAEIIGKWHFNSIKHLQEFSDKIADSVKKQTPWH
jgi:hypothetical protein